MGVIYNLPGVNNLTLSIRNIVHIYNGDQQYWNNTFIQKSNDNLNLPFQPVRPIARQDRDYSTGLFTQVLSANSLDWKTRIGTIYEPQFVGGNCCNSTKWPPGVIYMYGNMTIGMVGLVASIPYTVGYATISSLAGYTVNLAQLTTSTSNPRLIAPTVQSVQLAMSYYMNNSAPDELLLNLEVANESDAYPLSAFTYMTLNQTYFNISDICVLEEVVGFLDWILFTLSDEDMMSLNFVPLLPELKLRIKRLVLEKITYAGELVYPRYLASNTISSTTVGLQVWQISILAALLFLGILALAGCYVFRKYVINESDETRWIIESQRIKMLEKVYTHLRRISEATLSVQSITETLENVSVHQINTPINNESLSMIDTEAALSLKQQMVEAELDDIKVYLDKVDCQLPQNWNAATKRMMTRMKNGTNKNVCALMGVTVLKNEPYLIYEYCSKGTLHYVLSTTNYTITDDMKYQFAIDISRGMKYLHKRGIVNGLLNSLTCYMDSTWTVKISQWGQLPLAQMDQQEKIFNSPFYTGDNVLKDDQLIKLIYLDPQIRWLFNESVDIYSFGLILIEIFTQKLPCAKGGDNTVSYRDLLTKKFRRNVDVCWNFEQMPSNIVALTNACLSRENYRPRFKKICTELKVMTKITTGIVDIVMDSLERHVEKLEDEVEEKSAELTQVKEDS